MKRLTAPLAALVFLMVPLAGCMGFGGDEADFTPRTHEITLEVKAPTSTTIPLYELNGPTVSGRTHMEVVAMGFTYPDQDVLEVPNPTIRVKEGDTVIVNVLNNNPLPHTFHVHGNLEEWGMDGVPFLTQMPIHQGQEFRYVFEDMKAGTYWYHCHVDVAHHIDLGMYGAFIVEEREPEQKFDREFVLMLDEWDNCHVHGNLDPLTGAEQSGEFSNRVGCIERFLQDNLAQNQFAGNAANSVPPAAKDPACDTIAGLPNETVRDLLLEQLNCDGGHSVTPIQQAERGWYPATFPVYAPIYNTFLINGKAFPDTVPLAVKEGERIKVRLINVGEQMHSMHLHGHTMLVTHRDGYALDNPFKVDTLGIMPGERYDFIFEADNPGFWAFHDHIGLHVMNDDHAPGGMFTCVAYDGFHGYNAMEFDRAIECNEAAMEIFADAGHDHGGSHPAHVHPPGERHP
ncbi:MAG: multicopper oxidase family protein [Thermoplasmatota archaeon]